jgi:serine/threonine-protein kinase
MDTDSPSTIRALFEAALECPPEQRSRFIHAQCPDPVVCAKVLALLAADETIHPALAHDWVDRIANDLDTALTTASPERPPLPPGSRIGAFRILHVIGRGGFSTVFEAERELEGVVQRVAIKLMHCGLHTVDARRRFEHERRALLQLKHPNICHMIDAGVTDTGHPYIALELIEGRPITDYANDKRLGLRQRLRLFVDVCRAVSAAHCALIVHRDIKPSNVLVSNAGVVSLLDFGIAKLLDDPDEHHTAVPAFTPGYAAPEQREFGNNITTATDVYALGILLDELITGERRAPGESRSPSTRVGSTTRPNALPAPPQAMRRLLQGDLDNIVMKAVAEEPELRYASAGALAEDVERHLCNQPVLAHPPSRLYRTRKFVARHRGGVTLSIIALTAILAALGMALWQTHVARSQALRANAMRDFMFEVFAQAEPGAPRLKPPSVAEIVEDAIVRARDGSYGDTRASVELQTRLGAVLRAQSAIPQARNYLTQVYQQAKDQLGASDDLTLDAAAELVDTLVLAGDGKAARTLSDELLARTTTQAGRHTGALLLSSTVAGRQGDYPRAVADAREAVRSARSLGDEDRLAQALTANAQALNHVSALKVAARLTEELLQLQTRRFGPMHLHVADAHQGLSIIQRRLGDLDAAREHARKALEIAEAVLPENHHKRSKYINAMMMVQIAQHDFPAALGSAQASLQIDRHIYGPDQPEVANDLNNLGAIQLRLGDCAQAATSLQQALAISVKRDGATHPRSLRTQFNYGAALACSGAFSEGASQIRSAAEAIESAPQPDLEEAAAAWEKLARLHLDRNEPDAALPLLDHMDALLAKLENPPLYWPGRMATLRAHALLLAAKPKQALALLEAMGAEADRNLDIELPVEAALLRAVAATELGAPDAADQARLARNKLAALQHPSARLGRLAARLPAER